MVVFKLSAIKSIWYLRKRTVRDRIFKCGYFLRLVAVPNGWPQPNLNRTLTEPQPNLNPTATEPQPNRNRTATEPQPNRDRTATEPQPQC